MVTIEKPKIIIGKTVYVEVTNTTTSKPIYSYEEAVAREQGKVIATSR